MTINFYKLLADPRKLDKSGVNDLSPASIFPGGEYQASGTLRQACSVMDPVIQIEMPNDRVTNFNYLEIVDWSRFYFVRDVRVLRSGLVEISCHEDVLYTNKTTLLRTKVYVSRSESLYDSMLPDPRRIFSSEETLSLITNPNAPTTLDPTGTSAGGDDRFVITLATDNSLVGSTARTSTDWLVYPTIHTSSAAVLSKSWVVSRSRLWSFMTEFLNIQASSFLTAIYGAGTEGIISIKSFPFEIHDADLIDIQTGETPLRVMLHTMTTKGEPMREVAIKTINFGTYSYKIQATDFTDLEPYTTAQMYLPYYGVVSIPMVYMASGGVEVIYRVDCHTGDTIITIQAHGTGAYVKTLTCNLAEDIPVTQTNNVEMARNQMQNVLNTISGGVALAAGSPAGILPIAGTMANMATQHLTMSGSLNNPNMLRMLRFTPYVLISRRQERTLASSVYEMYGAPSEQVGQMANFSGVTYVEEIFQDRQTGLFGMSGEEWDEIKARLREGVIL